MIIDEILHADGSVARTFDEDIKDDNENMPSSSHDDASSDSEELRIQPSMNKVAHQATIIYVERSFQVLFIDDADISEVV